MTTDPSSDVLERVARALFDVEWRNLACEADFEASRDYWLKSARAAIAAMPTIERLSAELDALREALAETHNERGSLSAELERVKGALDVARKQIVEITCDATEKLREIGYECDPPERTYTPALDRIDAALSNTADTRA